MANLRACHALTELQHPLVQSERKGCVKTCCSLLVVFVAFSAGCLAVLIDVRYSRSDEPHTPHRMPITRTGFHFQPEGNWMNDPNGPMYYNGHYHFFYQYNPDGAVWGNISWGHAVSRNLIQWTHLPVAINPDKWYDEKGAWSGSAVILDDGTPAILYTGSSNDNVQLQNLALPENASDPHLTAWVKSPHNPIAMPPPGVSKFDFRDPSAWKGSDGVWRMIVGSRQNGTDCVLMYKSNDFNNWTDVPQTVKTGPGRAGMWECPDLYPVSTSGEAGLDTCFSNEDCRHVLKASYDDDFRDYYALGTYSQEDETWFPVDPQIDVHNGLRYDYGKFYASKTFFDPSTHRRILWGWVNESDSQSDDIAKGWASVQAIPRVVRLDKSTGKHLIMEPVEELKLLRGRHSHDADVTLNSGTNRLFEGFSSMQVDMEIVFTIPRILTSKEYLPLKSDCGWDENASRVVGRFGAHVLAASDLTEKTSIFFELAKGALGRWEVRMCSDQRRSSLSETAEKSTYGSQVLLHESEDTLKLRVLVDNSVVESFAQGGKSVITARAYPTQQSGKIYLFNSGSTSVQVKSVDVWEMMSSNNGVNVLMK